MTITAHLTPLDAGVRLDEITAAYQRDGAVLVRGLFDAADVAAIRAEVARHITEVVPTLTKDVHFEADGTTVRVVNELQSYSPYFAELIERPALVAAVAAITGWRPVPFYAEYFAKRPGGAVANPHQDSAFETVVPRQYVHVWVALDDITPDMGPLRVWLGSNRDGVFPHDEKDFGGFKYIGPDVVAGLGFPVAEGTATAGDALVLDTAIIHASSVNTSAKPRPSLALAYRGEGTRHVG